jgi:hypothetical protein
MFIAKLPSKRALAAFTVVAVLAVGTSLFHRPAPEADGFGAWITERA